jgi:hypothetical protein
MPEAPTRKRLAPNTVWPAVRAYLAEHGPATGSAIARATGLGRGSVKLVLWREDGYAVGRCGSVDNRQGGRPEVLWRLLTAGEVGRRGSWCEPEARLVILVNAADRLGEFARACRELAEAAAAEHAGALAAVRAWGERHTHPREGKRQ